MLKIWSQIKCSFFLMEHGIKTFIFLIIVCQIYTLKIKAKVVRQILHKLPAPHCVCEAYVCRLALFTLRIH